MTALSHLPGAGTASATGVPFTAAGRGGPIGHAEDVGRPVARLEIPRPRLTLILALAEPVCLSGLGHGAARIRYRAFVTGLGGRALIAGHSGRFSCIEMDLAPWAAPMLFGNSAAMSGGPIDLVELWGEAAVVMVDRLAAACNWQQRSAIVEAELRTRLAAPRSAVRGEIRWAWQRLEAEGGAGALGIRSLAREIGWSERHFTRLFTESLGIGPKAAARHLRLHHAIGMIDGDRQGLAGIAHAAGYSDQSHMNRDFAAAAGWTPAAYRRARDPELPGKPAAMLGF